MCGIFAALQDKNDAPQVTLDGLKRLEYRGYDSWGIGSIAESQIVVTKEVGKIGEAKVDQNSQLAIGHTRWATHGRVTRENAHPHLSCDQRWAIIHNGIIDNHEAGRKKLKQGGHSFVSETDSEVVAHLLEQESFFEVFGQLEGLNAIVALDAQTQQIFAAKTGSPLVVGFAESAYYLASDAAALLPYTREVYFLKDDEGVKISAKGVELWDLTKHTRLDIDKRTETLDWSAEEAQLSGHDHYLIKEIFEQPGIVQNIADQSEVEVRELTEYIRNSYGAYFVAAGTAFHAALAGEYLFSKIAQRHINLASASEFNYLSSFITHGSLVIPLTQSGETIDVVEAVKTSQRRGADVCAITNVKSSTVDRMADFTVLLRAGPEKSVLATKSYVAKLSVLLLTVYTLVGKLEEGRRLLYKAARAIESQLNKKSISQSKALAARLKTHQHLYLLGRGQSYVDALEGALKIKEVTYIHAEGFAGGDLKHGSIALIEEGTPVIVFVPNDETKEGILSNAMEVKARGAWIVGVSPQNENVFDDWIEVEDLGAASNLINIIPMQILAYYLALELDRDPDKPRNLAKSVTVR